MKNIVCDGFYSGDYDRYEVNMSAIWSYLIRECGKLVEDYNSDILIDINRIGYSITNEKDPSKVFWIGLRESGVDDKEYIKHRCENEYYYRGLYKITIEKTDRKCTVTLSKSSPYDFRKENTGI